MRENHQPSLNAAEAISSLMCLLPLVKLSLSRPLLFTAPLVSQRLQEKGKKRNESW